MVGCFAREASRGDTVKMTRVWPGVEGRVVGKTETEESIRALRISTVPEAVAINHECIARSRLEQRQDYFIGAMCVRIGSAGGR